MELQLRLARVDASHRSGFAAEEEVPRSEDRTDDSELARRAKTDRQAFALFYRRHYAVMASYILRRVGDVHLTEDLTAETFMAVLKYLPRYRDRGLPIRAWLYRIAANTVNRWVRRERKQIARSLTDLEMAESADQVLAVPASQHRDGRGDSEHARLALLTLPPKFQAVLTLHYLEGLNLEEVAAALGCRLGTVKSRLSRGRDALRQRLTKQNRARSRP